MTHMNPNQDAQKWLLAYDSEGSEVWEPYDPTTDYVGAVAQNLVDFPPSPNEWTDECEGEATRILRQAWEERHQEWARALR